MTVRSLLPLCIAIAFVLDPSGASGNPSIFGVWRFDADKSTDIASWKGRLPNLEIRERGGTMTIVHDWRRGRGSWTDTLTVVPGGDSSSTIVTSPIWPQNWFVGVLAKVGGTRTATAQWSEPGTRLVTEIEQVVEVSQGEATIVTTCEFALGPDGDTLIVTGSRSTRPAPVVMVFDRVSAESRK